MTSKGERLPFNDCWPYDAWWPPLPPDKGDGSADDEKYDEVFCAVRDDLLLLDVQTGSSTPFSSSEHYPIFAGYGPGRMKEYIAIVCVRKSFSLWCTVTDGARFVQYYDRGGHLRRTKHFQVPVLRFEPEEYGAQAYETIKMDRGVDSTGPVYWRPWCGDEGIP